MHKKENVWGVKSVLLNPEIASVSPVRFEKCMFLLSMLSFHCLELFKIFPSYRHFSDHPITDTRIDISDPILVMQCFCRDSIVSLKQPASKGNLDLSRPIRLDLTASLEALPLYVPKKKPLRSKRDLMGCNFAR